MPDGPSGRRGQLSDVDRRFLVDGDRRGQRLRYLVREEVGVELQQVVVAALAARDSIAARTAAEEGRDLADAIGDRFDARRCRWYLAVVQLHRGDLAGAVAQFTAVADEAEAGHDEIWRVDSLVGLGFALAYQGDIAAARAAADAAVEATAELGGLKRAAPTTPWL